MPFRAGWRTAEVRGFTLVELMVTLTVLGILISFALPSFGRFIRDQRVKTATTDVYASIVYARSESIKRGADVQVNPVNAADWALGWSVVDAAANNLKVQDAIPGVAATGPASLTYRRDGRLNGAVSIFVVSTDDVTVPARCIRVDPSGRPNIQVDTNGIAADGCQ